MAIAIVEELWARIRAVIDDKIVAAEDAAARAEGVADAFGSLEGVVDQVQAASGYAQAALEEADRSSSEADRAEAAAQSASTGVQPDTVGRLHLTPALRGEIDGKAAASHQHSWSDVTDKPSTFTPSAHTHTPASIGAAPASHTHSEYATTADMQNRTPEIRVVSSPEMATSPGVLYVVRED